MDAFKHLAKTTPSPMGLEIVRAQGSYLYDKEGKEYLDLISGVAVNNLGHGHPAVLGAIEEQSKRHLHTMVYGEFVQQAQADLADLLINNLPDQFEKVYFTNSGTEAIEGAMKLAKRSTGRQKIIAFEGAYHGNTQGSMSLMSSEWRKEAFIPLLPDIHHIPFDSIEHLEQIDNSTAAVIIEPVQGDAGIRVPSQEFISALRDKCTETASILVFDEVQTGIGRTGKLFALEHFNVQPDILVLGKALGGGLPIGAFIASSELMDQLSHDPPLGHITTFGGNPLSCAAGNAALNALLEEGHIEEIEAKGQQFMNALEHPLIKAKRGIGLMMAFEIKSEDLVWKIIHKGIEKGILLFSFISCPNALRLAPPLNISNEDIDRACSMILECLDEVGQN